MKYIPNKEENNNTKNSVPLCCSTIFSCSQSADCNAWRGKAPNDDQLEIALNQNPETLGDY